MRKYKIPYTLDTSILDASAPLTLNSKTVGDSTKEVSLRDLLIWVIAFIVGFNIVTKPMFLGNGSILSTIVFLIGYVIFIRVLFKSTKIPAVLNWQTSLTYLQNLIAKANKRNRIQTTVFGDYDLVASTIGLLEPDTTTNTHHFANGDIGRMRRIIGSASNNVFDADRDAIVSDYQVFLRQLVEQVSYSFITVVANQRVYQQLRALNYQKANEDNIMIIQSIDEDIAALQTIAEKSYKSLHQYLLIRASSEDDLVDAENLLDAFTQQRNGAIASAIPEPLSHQITTFRAIYSTVQTETEGD